MFIENLLSIWHNEEHNNSKKIFYFLTNVAGVMECVQDILRKGHAVVNKTFLLRENSKFYLQKIIEKNGVIVPKSICPSNNKDIREIDFPCYLKSQKQASTVVKVVNKKQFDEAICLFDSNKEDWYLEEAIDMDDIWLQKVYYVDGKIFEAKKNSFLFKITSNSMAKALDLEIFSFDIFSSKFGRYWVIDVNPAPSFFKSDKARKFFVQFIIKKLLDNKG